MTATRLLRTCVLAAGCLTALGDVGLAQEPALVPIATIETSGSIISVEGTRLYAIGGKALDIFDIKDAAAPRRLGGYSFAEPIVALAAFGSTVYVSADYNTLRIIDVRNPAAPVEQGSIFIRGGMQAIAPAGPGLLVSSTSLEGFEVVDVSTPSTPVRVGSNLYTDTYSQAVLAIGQQTVLATDASQGLFVFDITSPKSPKIIGMLPLAYVDLDRNTAPATISPDVAVDASRGVSRATIVAVLNKVSGRFDMVDLMDPRKPTIVGTLELGGRAQCHAFLGSRVYVGDRQGVQIIDVSKPSQPAKVGTIKTTQPVSHLVASDGHLFAALGRGGVTIFRPPS